MELTVWPARWDAASLDGDCLAALAYVRFAGAPVRVRVHRPTLAASPAGLSELPRLRHGANCVRGGAGADAIERLFAYLRKENYGVEYDFSEDRLVRMTALMRDARLRLGPAVTQLWWLDARVYTRVTRPAFAEAVGLPVSLAYPVWRHRTARRRLLAGFGYDLGRIGEDALMRQVTTDGVDCLRRLAQSLGDARYFVADAAPCCLDALVFGYLWPLLRAPLSPGGGGGGDGESPALLRELRRHRNLLDFCQRVQRAYFPEFAASVTASADAAASPDGDKGGGGGGGGGGSGVDGAALRNAGLFLALTSLVFGVYAWQSGWIVVQP